MKKVSIAIVGLLIALAAIRALYVYMDRTYVNFFEAECIAEKDNVEFFTQDYLDKHKQCKVVSRGKFMESAYVHIECGDGHVLVGSQVHFDSKSACEAFARLNYAAKRSATGNP